MMVTARQTSLTESLASDGVLDAAYRWLCHQRRGHRPDSDVWSLRHHWQSLKVELRHRLLRGKYRFSPVDVRVTADGERVESWCAGDALLLKALALVLTGFLSPHLSPQCVHLKGNGGSKGAVRKVRDVLESGTHQNVFRTDVRHYYASIHHASLLRQLRLHVDDPTPSCSIWPASIASARFAGRDATASSSVASRWAVRSRR